MKPHQPRCSGPRVEALTGEGPQAYHIQGLRTWSPTFRTRGEAERWLVDELSRLPPERRPQKRECMRCGDLFVSEGFHNRLCTGCRHAMAHDVLPATALAAGTSKIKRAARA